MRRRELLVAAAGLAGCGGPIVPRDQEPDRPRFLDGYEAQYADDPGSAARAWFRDARCGLFLQYGVYSQLRRGPNVQFDERIPLARYGELDATFDPGGFDAGRIADLALASGMRYVGLTARHADGFSMFRTIETDFNSLESSGRDLLGELAEACRERGLGLLPSYSYAADWRHPYFFPPETARSNWRGARPAYDSPPDEYVFEKDEDFLHYIRYAHNQLQEIVYRYEEIAGIRLEPASGYHARPDLFPVAQAYSILREARPGLLVAFGPGADGDEDFGALDGEVPGAVGERIATVDRVSHGRKRLEICHSLTDRHAGGGPETARKTASELVRLLEGASARGANLLVRTQLNPDGSIDAEDERTLLEFGRRRGA